MNRHEDTTTLLKPQHLNEPASERPPQAHHKAFTWLPRGSENDQDAKFTALVKDITSGARIALELVHMSNLDRDMGEAPTLNENQTEAMMFLAMRSIELLSDLADERIMRLVRIDRDVKANATAAADEVAQ